MAGKYSFEALNEFLDYVGEKGLMNVRTAKSYRTALSKIEDALTEAELGDVRSIDEEEVFQRFLNRNKVELSPRSLAEYRRRLRASIDEFSAWIADPTAYKPKGIQRTRRRSSTKRTNGRGHQRAEDQADAKGESADPETAAKILTVPFPLRPDFLATVQVPRDMNAAEANRLSAFIRTLARDFEP